MRFSHLSRGIAGTLWVLAGCSTNDDMEVASSFIKTVDVRASDGATLTVSASESPELAGAKLMIPPGSLTADTRITVALQRQAIAVAPNFPAGPVAIWGPAGTTFTTGAELTLPFALAADEATAALYLQVLEEDGTRAHIEGADLTVASRDAGLSTATIYGFTRFQNGVHGCASGDPPPEHVDHSCPQGTTCHRGRCEPDAIPTDPEVCTGGLDEDGDGLVDCDDTLDCGQSDACACPRQVAYCNNGQLAYQCCPATECNVPPYTVCGNGTCVTDPNTCAPDVENCSDQIDNDGDGLIDCADVYDCANAPHCVCDPVTTCCNPSDPACAAETTCNDQLDNDGDGAIDCRDTDCADAAPCRMCCAVWDPAQNATCVAACDPGNQTCACSPLYCAANGGPCP